MAMMMKINYDNDDNNEDYDAFDDNDDCRYVITKMKRIMKIMTMM